MNNISSFSATELLTVDGYVYHLGLRPEELANDIIIVGDPDRVSVIADEYLVIKEVDRFHRGLRTVTGITKEGHQRVSITTSGMGTSSLEIVLNEIVALNELDLQKRERRRADPDKINIIRVGTSGGLQPDTPLGALIITEFAVGLDNTGFFYDISQYDKESQILEDRVREAIDRIVSSDSRFKGRIFPYASRANFDLVKTLEEAANELSVDYVKGITVSSSGFFANQGRDISKLPITVPNIDRLLASIDTGVEGLKIENMEMEASFLLHFMGALGYRAGVLCPVIAHRRKEVFLRQYTEQISDATKVALNGLYKFRFQIS